jgi:hypothetical protein
MPGRIHRLLPAFVAVAVGCALRRTLQARTDDSPLLLASLPNSRTRRTRATIDDGENQRYGRQIGE